MALVDTHVHLDVEAFDVDRAAVVARARANGVIQQIVPAIDAAGWPGLREVCRNHEGLFAAYGLHPVFLTLHLPQHLLLLREWIEREQPLAIGECGLDYFVEGLDQKEQHRYFEGQLHLAREFDLPLIVHARRAVDAVIAAIKAVGGLRGVVHSFSGSPEQAQQLWKLGFMLGIGGPITYERAARLRRLVATMPIEHLLLETDSPDQPGAGRQGQRNEPAHLLDVCITVAELRGIEPAEVVTRTTTNAVRLFKLPAPAPA